MSEKYKDLQARAESAAYVLDNCAQGVVQVIPSRLNRVSLTLRELNGAVTDRQAEIDRMRGELARMRELAKRAIGYHYAPNDCYATGPLTGDSFRDLVECPACSLIAALADGEGVGK